MNVVEINTRHKLTASQKVDREGHLLECLSCRNEIGIETKKTGYFQLFKWNVALQTPDCRGWETSTLQTIISAQLLALIEDQAVSKFIIHTGNIECTKKALFVRGTLNVKLVYLLTKRIALGV